MKSPFKISILVWACNILLVLMSLTIAAGTVYYFKIPAIIKSISETGGNESVTRASFRFSQSFLSDNFAVERNVDRAAGIDKVNYYFASAKNVYKVSFVDSLNLQANKINREFSSEQTRYFGFEQKSIVVTEPAGSVPVRFAAPAISISREEFIRYAKSNVLYLLSALLYGMLFIWVLRKFIAGLRSPDFFNHKNSFYLKVTAWLTIAAPVLRWFWGSYLRPDLFADYQFTRAAEVTSGFGLPALMLFFGLVLLIIAWCFDQGVKLQQEQELTI